LDKAPSIAFSRVLVLKSSVISPKLEEKTGRLPQIEGQPPLLYDLPEGDAFAPRSPLKFDEEDAKGRPPLVEVKPGHWVQLSKSSVADYDKFSHLIEK